MIFHADANGLALTANTETIYGVTVLDTKPDGPVVVEVPPMVLGLARASPRDASYELPSASRRGSSGWRQRQR